jgi:ABC-2 type transport system permease protein
MSPRRTLTVARHELRLVSRDPLPVMILVVFPLILMAFLKPAFRYALVAGGYPHANGAEQVVPGEAVANGFYIVGMTSFAFFSEYAWCTWERLRTTPAISIEIIAGKALPRLGLSCAQFLVIFAVSIPLFHLHVRGALLALVPLVAAFALCLVMLGVAVTAVCRTVQQANAVAFGGLVLFGAIGGALVPINVLRAWAHTIAPATPTYWAMRGFRSVILTPTSPNAVALPATILLAMSLAFAVISVVKFRLDDTKSSWT